MKRLLSLILAAAMLASMLALGAFADESDPYALWVNGEKFSAETVEIACGAGKASFDVSSATLTLENAEITALAEYQPWCSAAVASKLPELKIFLAGESVINAGNGDGIGADLGCSVSIVGDGKLTITGYYGIYVSGWGSDEGDLFIGDGATVVVNDTQAAGLWAQRNITFDKATVTVDRSERENYNGIVSNSGGTVVVRDSTVEVKNAAAALHFGNGDSSSHALVVESGSLTLVSTAEDPESDRLGYALFVEPYEDVESGTKVVNGEITVKGGTLSLSSTKSVTNVPADKITLGEGVSFAAGESLADGGTVTLTNAASGEHAIKLVGAKAYSDPERTKEITSAAPGTTIYLAATLGEKQYIDSVICDPDVQFDMSGEVTMPDHDLSITFVILDQKEKVVDLTLGSATVDALLINGVNGALKGIDYIEMKDEFVFDLNKDGKDDVKATIVLPSGDSLPVFTVEAISHDDLPNAVSIETGTSCPYSPVVFKLPAPNVVYVSEIVLEGAAFETVCAGNSPEFYATAPEGAIYTVKPLGPSEDGRLEWRGDDDSGVSNDERINQSLEAGGRLITRFKAGVTYSLYVYVMFNYSQIPQGKTAVFSDNLKLVVDGEEMIPEKLFVNETKNYAVFEAAISIKAAFAPGDVNHDEKVNAKDVTAIMKHIVGSEVKTFFESEADFDKNEKINAKDVSALMKYLVSR